MPAQQIANIASDRHRLLKHSSWVLLLGLIAAVVAMIFWDQSVSQYFSDPTVRSAVRKEARFLTDLGLSEIYFAIGLLTWGLGAWVTPRLKLSAKLHTLTDFFRRWGLNLLLSLVVSGILIHTIKFLVGRQRPHKTPDFDPHIFNHFTTHWHWHSFPSGHTQVIFTAATLFVIAFPKFKWFWLGLAALIGLTRIVVHDHFLSDVIFGGCIGYVGALVSMYWMKKKTKNGIV